MSKLDELAKERLERLKYGESPETETDRRERKYEFQSDCADDPEPEEDEP